jgi:hypothetical protein
MPSICRVPELTSTEHEVIDASCRCPLRLRGGRFSFWEKKDLVAPGGSNYHGEATSDATEEGLVADGDVACARHRRPSVNRLELRRPRFRAPGFPSYFPVLDWTSGTIYFGVEHSSAAVDRRRDPQCQST